MPRQRVLLGGTELPAQARGDALSSEARRLLSQLAAELGFDCPHPLWSPRGIGPPTHPALPADWFAGITHKRGRVIVGLSDQPFGIDLEAFNPSHAKRLDGLIEMLPEPPVQQAIQHASCPQQAFYQAWTLHEALFKLASQTTQPSNSVLATRLQPALAITEQNRLWQSRQWTFALTGCAPLSLDVNPESILPGAVPVQFSMNLLEAGCYLGGSSTSSYQE